MKKLFCWLIVLLCLVSTARGENITISYEQLVSGKYDGDTIEVNAKALPITPYYNLIYLWTVEKEDGSFEVVDNSETRWCVTEEDYKRASSREKKAFDNGEVFTLEIKLFENGTPRVNSFRLQGTMSQEQMLQQYSLISLGVIAVLICISVVCFKRSRNSPPKYRPVAVRTKFIDSSHTATAQTKTCSAVGRAAVGSLIAGPVGALVGAGTAKQKIVEYHTTTFIVYYNDGSRKAETVSNGSYQYKRYMELLDVGD